MWYNGGCQHLCKYRYKYGTFSSACILEWLSHVCMNVKIWYIWITYNNMMLSDAYMRQWTKQSFVQLVACRLFCAKLFSEPVLAYRWSGHYEQTLKKMFKIQSFHLQRAPECVVCNIVAISVAHDSSMALLIAVGLCHPSLLDWCELFNAYTYRVCNKH